MIRTTKIIEYCFLAIASLSTNCWAQADKDWQDTIEFHGFAAQSYIHTSDNNFFGESEDGSFEFWELGLNSLWRPTSWMQFAIQAVARDAGKTDDGKIRIDYSFFDFTFSNSDTGASGLRIGRIVNPAGFYNETRDVVATRPSILLPQSIYFDVNRNLALSSDGIQLYHEVSDYTFQFGVFEPRTKDPDFEPAIFFQEVPGHLEGTTSWMGRILYERNFGMIRLGFTAAEINVDYDPANMDPIPPGDFQYRPYVLSAQYNQENWSLTAEYAKRTTELNGFAPFMDIEFTGTSYFVQGTYRLSSDFELFARYDQLIWNDDDKNGKEFEGLTGLPSYSRFAKDWTLGLRWDINQNIMVRTELHNVNGTGWLSLLENPVPQDTVQYWNLFAATIALRF